MFVSAAQLGQHVRLFPPTHCVSRLESARIGGYRSQPMLACRFVNRVVTASDSVDTSRMERLVLCACVGPQRTLDAPGEGAKSLARVRAAGGGSAARAPGDCSLL